MCATQPEMFFFRSLEHGKSPPPLHLVLVCIRTAGGSRTDRRIGTKDVAPLAVGDVIAARVLAESRMRQMDAATSVLLAEAQSKWLDVELKQAQVFWEKRLAYSVNRQTLPKTKMATTGEPQVEIVARVGPAAESP